MATSRLSPLDAAFLHLEDGSAAHMHVGAVFVFPGDPPAYGELLAAVERRLHLVPRYRQRLYYPPLPLAEPEWVDDPHFQLEFHVRHSALPRPGTPEQLRLLAGRVFSQRLDRFRPLWEMWLVEGLRGVGDDRRSQGFAVVSKTHHCLVDGISGVDIATILFDVEREPPDQGRPPRPWIPAPLPTPAQSLARAASDRLLAPAAAARAALHATREPEAMAAAVRHALDGIATLTAATLRPAPESIYTVPIGPHRRFTWVRASLDEVKSVKNALGGTVNDVVLAAVTGALRRHLLQRDEQIRPEGLVAMVPVSVRSEAQRGALGNRVSSMYATLPVDVRDPVERLRHVGEQMRSLKESGQAVGAQLLTEMGGLAPPTILAQAARLGASPRLFNLTITNVPGPQIPLYLLRRELGELIPLVPLAPDHALGVAVISYNGRLCFGLVGDYDRLHDIQDLAGHLRAELDALVTAAERSGVAVTRRTPAAPDRRGRGRSRPAVAAPRRRG